MGSAIKWVTYVARTGPRGVRSALTECFGGRCIGEQVVMIRNYAWLAMSDGTALGVGLSKVAGICLAEVVLSCGSLLSLSSKATDGVS